MNCLFFFSKELAKAKCKSPSNDFSYFIIICKLYKMKQSKKANKNNQSEQVIWSNAEEEIFDEVWFSKQQLHVTKIINILLFSGIWVQIWVLRAKWKRLWLGRQLEWRGFWNDSIQACLNFFCTKTWLHSKQNTIFVK